MQVNSVQLTDPSAQITVLQEQIPAAHDEGQMEGVGIGVGVSLIVFAIILGVNKLMGDYTVTEKPRAKAASA